MSPPDLPNQPDLLIVGGGLAGALTALAFAKLRPEVKVELIDGGDSFGGNHVWSLFASDLSAEGRDLIEPLVEARWPAYDIAFPRRRRTIATPYASLTSERLDAELRRMLGDRARTGIVVENVDPHGARLAGGERIESTHAIDARGPGREVAGYDCGWQKFVGQELQLAAPHGLTRPIVMDATVDQIDGYRFIYVLPFGPDRLFVEDTYYSDDPAIDREAIAARIADYAHMKGWDVTGIGREEQGCIPVVIGGDFDALWPADDAVGRVGVRAGLFHPTTGYSLPHAVETALALARAWPLDDPAAFLRQRAARVWARGGFYRMLDTMLFRAAKPHERYRVLQHFYRLPRPLVERFYAGKSTWVDRMKVLSGRPPIPIAVAMRALAGRK
jgi:lycopene beta-cyclase